MTNTIWLAASNIWRNKRRTLLTELVIVFGLVVVLFTSSFLDSMSANWRDAIVNSDLGHIQIMNPQYREHLTSMPLSKPLEDPDAIVSALSTNDQILGATKRVSAAGLISGSDETASFFGRGVKVEEVKMVLPSIYKTLVAGSELSVEDKTGALLGEGLANSINAKIGDQLLISVYDRYKSLNAVEITIKGFLRIPDEIANNQFLLTHYETMAELVGYDGEATEVVVNTRSLENLYAVSQYTKNVLSTRGDYAVVTWEELSGSFKQASNMFSFMTLVIGGIIYFVILATLANTILTNVFDRISEIGMMFALGSSRKRILFQYIMESIILGVVGVFVGTVFFGLIIASLATSGITVPPPPGAIDAIVLFPQFSASDTVTATVLIVITTVVAAIYPARFATKLNPIVAIQAK